ncbi:MAG: 1-deoxy-D-xylulose-5-phosphate synthase [Lachnospiraceae bacterium]|nr:1-deoxy-D-xylulose-5-phosphate synthase [Lachnospiraceae bacterium]
MGKLLNQIVKENDIKNIAPEDYRELAKEIRIKLVRSVSHTGGHLAANLGVVELTMALHLFLDFPEDKLVWDVGHQSYVHKLLTGRADAFGSLRRMGGLSGFPKVKENPSDTFDTGHSSTSISVALGLAKARDLRGGQEKVFAVIGDGALSGGMAFEALNNAAALQSNLVIVLNDNKMSIAPNVGGMSNYLGKIRANQRYRNLKASVENALDKIPNLGQPLANRIKRAKDSLKHLFIPGMLFEDMGLIYIGPVDGHNIGEMLTAFQTAASVKDQPALVHVFTKKGKGYKPAEEKPSMFHGIGAFDIQSGEPLAEEKLTYTKIFEQWMLAMGSQREDVVSVCAAMPDGTGVRAFSERYPERFFDVGIAEEHAVTFAAGLAAGGMRPVVSLYSTFLQRAYDQMLHDVCLNSMPVVFTVDRSGIVGQDGETHQGIFDISYLSSMPNMTILSPMDGAELVEALNFAMKIEGPVAVRYPRGEAFRLERNTRPPLEYGKAEILETGKEVLILAVGNMVEHALSAAGELRKGHISSTVVNMRFVKPFDEELVLAQAEKHRLVVTMEDNVYSGGFSEKIQAFLQKHRQSRLPCLPICLPDAFIEHGRPEELYEKYGMDAGAVAEKIREALVRRKKG